MNYSDRIATEYFDRHDQPIQRYATKVEARWLRRFIAPRSRVLLAGSGGGREIPTLLGLGCDVVALDFSSRMVEVGQDQWGKSVSWVLADVHALPTGEGVFSQVVSLAALNYFDDIDLALTNLIGALEPGGVLIVSSINRLHATEISATKSELRNTYSPEELRQHLRGAGLRVTSTRGLRFLVDRLPADWNRAGARWPARLGLRLLLGLERPLRLLMPADKAKFFWVVGERP